MFSLGVDVTGLSDPGTLAAGVSPAVQSLMNSQVGTWRQRMGVIDQFHDGAVSLWARVFQDKGSVDPEHVAVNFGQGGNFGYDQKNSGVEAGLDFAISDEFSMGLLVAKSKADIDLEGPGVGRNKIDADTWGIYGMDLQRFLRGCLDRWMDFESRMDSVAGDCVPMARRASTSKLVMPGRCRWSEDRAAAAVHAPQVDNMDLVRSVANSSPGRRFFARRAGLAFARALARRAARF